MRFEDHPVFHLAGIFLLLLGLTVVILGTYRAIRHHKPRTFIEGLVLIGLAFLVLMLAHSTSID